MIEGKIDFLARFKILNGKLRKITDEIDNFVKEEEIILNREVEKDPTLVLKLMKKGRERTSGTDWKLF